MGKTGQGKLPEHENLSSTCLAMNLISQSARNRDGAKETAYSNSLLQQRTKCFKGTTHHSDKAELPLMYKE